MPHALVPAALRRVTLFQTLDDAELTQLAGLLREQRYQRGQCLFHQGDPGGCLYLISSGRVRIYLTSEDGREATVRVLRAGSALGELSVLDGQPRSASALAVEDTITYTLFRDDFMRLLRESFALAEQLLSQLAERLRFTTDFSSQLAFLSATQRVAAALQRLAEAETDTNGPVRVTITQQELAAFAGATREWANRALHELAARDLVRLERGAVIVLNRAGLGELLTT